MSETAEKVAFSVRNSLRKPFELPFDLNLLDSDVLFSTKVLSCYKSKGFLWDSTSSTKDRQITILKTGQIILQIDSFRGFILDIRGAKKTTFRYRKLADSPSFGCAKADVSIKFKFGSLHAHLEEKEISVWRKIMEKVDEMVLEGKITVEERDGVTVTENSAVFPTGKSESRQSFNNSITLKEPIDISEVKATNSDVSVTVADNVSGTEKTSQMDNFDPESVEESSCSGLLTKEEKIVNNCPSIRTGYSSDIQLKEKLEHQLDFTKNSKDLKSEFPFEVDFTIENDSPLTQKKKYERRPTFYQY